MMPRILATLCLLLAAAAATRAQSSAPCVTAAGHSRNHLAKITLASPALDSYDVKWVKLDLAISNLNTTVRGSATTTAVSKAAAGLSSYVFEMSAHLIADSAKLNGANVSVTSLSADLRSIAIPAAIPAGATFTAQIFYHGTVPAGTGFFTHAFNRYTLSGTDINFTLSDPYLAKEWWPCKQSLTDKIDSADLWFTAPSGTMVGSNGLLQRSTSLGAAGTRWEWKTRYPIDYYLICASVAPYIAHTQILHFSGSTDSMPIQHFVYDTATFYPANRPATDSTPYLVDYFSQLYGRYPFWREKYGHCIAPLSGGMEHQTMTTLGAFTTPLISHELGHQWWGDCVTYGSWRDVWLSEGFATYTEQLFVEHFRGAAAFYNYRSGVFGQVLGGLGGTVYVDDTTNATRIFDSRLTYAKGAAVAHMLRYIAPNDSTFFSGLRAYQQQYAFKTATTADFEAVMETAYGRRLDTFFNQWVYSEGYPIYTPTYNQRGNDVWLRLDQTTSKPTSVAAFALPVALRLVSATGDTVVKVYLAASTGVYHFKWSQTVNDVVVDPNNDIVNLTYPLEYDGSLGVKETAETAFQVFPNPTSNGWAVNDIPQGAYLQLADVTGRVVVEMKDIPGKAFISAAQLPPGIYTLSIRDAKGLRSVRKLVRQ